MLGKNHGGDCESQPCPLWFGRKEGVKNLVGYPVRNTNPAVFYFHDDGTSAVRRSQHHCSASSRCLHSVDDKIEQYLFQLFRVAFNFRTTLKRLMDQGDLTGFRRVSSQCGDRSKYGIRIGFVQTWRTRLGKIQKA